MKSILNKVGYFLFLIIIMVFAKSIGKTIVKGVRKSSNTLTYDDSLKLYLGAFPKIEDSLNQNSRLIDDYTSLDSVNCSIENNEITYYHTMIKNSKDDFDLDVFKSTLQNQIDSVVQNNPKMAMQRQFNTKLNYIYFDKNGAFFAEINAKY